MAAFDGAWLDNEGNDLLITGETVTGPAGMKIDVAFESADTCLMQMADDIFEGKLSADRSRITWSDGEAWRRKPSAPAAAEDRGAFQPEARSTTLAVAQPSFSLEDAMGMQEELHEAFSSPAFQIKLSELYRTFPKRKGKEFLAARNVLFLEVQSVILPKYGFEGSEKGVIQMLTAASRHNSNKEFCVKRTQLNILLGLEVEEEEKKPVKKPPPKNDFGSLGIHNLMLRSQNLASAQAHLLGPSSLQMNLTKPQKEAQLDATKLLAELSSQNKMEKLLRQQAEEDCPPEDVEIIAREALGDLEITVIVSGSATFNEVKEAISKHVGRPDIVKRGHLVRHVDGNYTPFKGSNKIGDVREVLVLRASLEVHDDDEARSWRTEIDGSISKREAEHKRLVASAKKRQTALAQKELEIASRPPREEPPAPAPAPAPAPLPAAPSRGPPHGECYIIGTWDAFAGRHEMAWDGTAYRIGMNLQGMEEVSFQILVGKDQGRIYPSEANAGPKVPHYVLGPVDKRIKQYWKLSVQAAKGEEDQCTYEIALYCPSDSPMLLQWEKISLDAIQWYPTEEQG